MSANETNSPFMSTFINSKPLLVELHVFQLCFLIDIKIRKYSLRSQKTSVLKRIRTTKYCLRSFRCNVAQIRRNEPMSNGNIY